MVSNIICWCYFGLTNHDQTSMHVPEPVISLAIKPQGQETPNFARALNRFRKEDPTFKVHFDKDSKEVCQNSCSIS
jgi:elongation factor G